MVTAGPVIGVLALQGDFADHERILAGLGARTRRVRLPQDLAGIDGLLIPGGESTTMWRLAEDFGLLEPVAAAIAAGLPALGSCAGMIMLADEVLDGRPGQRTFGGLDITVRRNAFGRQVNSFEADLDLPAVGAPAVRGVFIRAPWVERVGPQVEVLARVVGRDGRTHAVAVRQGTVLATAFHPELTGDGRLHGLLLAAVGRAAGAAGSSG